MTRHLVFTLGVLLALTGPGLSEAQAADVTNVTALTAPCATSAIPNDGVDDTAAIQCALTSVPGGSPDGGEVYFPAGQYDLWGTLTITDKRIALRGEGQGITRLVWHQTTAPDHNGIQFLSTTAVANPPNPNAVNFTLAVRSLSLLRAAGEGGAALSATWTKPSGPNGHHSLGTVTTTIHDVHTGSEPWNGSAYWYMGIQLTNPTTAKIDTFNIQGTAWFNGIAGIQIRGSDPTGKTIGVSIRDGSITRYVRGIESKDESEGLHIQKVSMHEVSWGIIFYITGQGTVIANNSIQARTRGIQVFEGRAELAISNNLIRRFDTDAFIGIELSNPTRDGGGSRIIGNSIYSPTTGQTPYGIVLGGRLYDNVVEGNTTHNMNIGIWLNGVNVQRNIVLGNINRNAVTQTVDTGAPGSNHFAHNIP
jgi:hypothetical protein